MIDLTILIGGFVGGLFLGYLTALFAFFVWQLIREGLGNPKQMAIPAICLLSMFGAALVYLIGGVLQSWPILIGAVITFSHGARGLFKQDEEGNQKSKP